VDDVVSNGKTGYLFDPFDAGEMARSLIRLAEDPALWHRLSLAAEERGELQFSGAYQAARVMHVFQNLSNPDGKTSSVRC